MGKKAEGLEFLQYGREIIARLVELSPENAQWRRDLDWFDRTMAPLQP